MSAPLAGLRVLVTRPEGQAEGVMSRLRALGAEVLHWPALRIEARALTRQERERLARWGQYDLALFVSANAVRHAASCLQGPLPRLAAIGRSTAQALTGQGWPVALVAPPPYNSEALLGLPELQDLHGQRLLLLRGEGGRRHLAETLRSRGAKLDEVACYRRLRGDAGTLQPLLQPLPHMAMVTSGEALLSLQDALGSRRSGMVLVAGGERVAGSASGWQQVVVAPDPSDEAMTGAVLQSQQSMGKPSA